MSVQHLGSGLRFRATVCQSKLLGYFDTQSVYFIHLLFEYILTKAQYYVPCRYTNQMKEYPFIKVQETDTLFNLEQ